MKRNMRRIAAMLLTLVLVLAGIPASAITQAERETVISGAIQEIEAYLLPGEDSADLEKLMDTLAQVGGNGDLLYSYVEILLSLESGRYGDALSNATLYCTNERFSAYLDEVGSDILGTANDLLNYVRGRSAEANGALDEAGEYYRLCIPYYDSRARRKDYEEIKEAEAFDQAQRYLSAEDYYAAYLLLAQLSARDYKNSSLRLEGIQEQHPEVLERLQKEGVDFNYSGTIPEGYRLFSGATAPTPEPTPTPTASPTSEPTPSPTPSPGPTATPKPTETPAPRITLQTGEIEDSWEEIIAAIDDGTAKHRYAVGSWKPLELEGIGTINMQLAGFELDELADGTGKAPTTWIAKELLPDKQPMYRDYQGTTLDWCHSDLRAYLQETVLPTLPAKVRKRVIEIKKQQNKEETRDKIWIPRFEEVYGYAALYCDLFYDRDSMRVKTYNGFNTQWWLRSYVRDMFFTVWEDGTSTYCWPAESVGVAIGFCL